VDYVPPVAPVKFAIAPIVIVERQLIDYVFRFRCQLFSKALVLSFVERKPPEEYRPTNARNDARTDSDPPSGAQTAHPPFAGLAFFELYWVNGGAPGHDPLDILDKGEEGRSSIGAGPTRQVRTMSLPEGHRWLARVDEHRDKHATSPTLGRLGNHPVGIDGVR
jgi:hypothetical protein